MLYPILNASRALIDLSGIWNFKLDEGNGFEEHWEQKPLSNPMTIAVPGSYNDQKEGVSFRDHYGWVFYQKTVKVPKVLSTQRVMLRFGSVTHSAKVYWNGELICEHDGGFLPFEVEISDKLDKKEHLLTVAVDNTINYATLPLGNESRVAMFGSDLPDIESIRQLGLKKQNYPNFDFFNYSGIHRPVKIYTTPKNYIEDITITTSIKGSKAEVSYQVKTSAPGDVKVILYDEEENLVGVGEGNEGMIEINDVHLWQPGNAYLYKACIRYEEDEYEETFGVRSVEVKGNQFLINHKPFYFKGFGKHEDSIHHGKGLDEVLNVKDISLMKWCHANSFRTSHYPYAEEMLNLCDREGIVVIDETSAVGLNFSNLDVYKVSKSKELHKQMIIDQIQRDKNHPCIVMWSLANEPDTAVYPDSALEYFTELYDLAHAQDPQNRPVTVVCCQNDYVKDKVALAMDVICLNRYYGWYNYAGDLDFAKKAMEIEWQYWAKVNKPLMMTEYGADTVAGIHGTTPNMFCEEFQVEYLEMVHSVLDKYDFVMGEQVWNFADFATIQGTLRVDGNKKGIFTRDRKPKLAAHYLRNRWKNIPDFGYKK